MAFAQLYYTSCEHGLSGYAGFQFNAATPGVPPEVLRAVEGITSYEPPESMGFEPGPAEIAAAPVNLCYVPETPEGPAVLARVEFVGADYSNRFGNYFAHALLTAEPGRELAPLVPAGLWDSPCWVSAPVSDPDLPELAGPLPPGVTTRPAVEAFLERSGHLARLPALIRAADLAIGGGTRSVLLVAPDAAAVAYWLAAVSYLLPPPLAARMSFCTYTSRPSRSTLHVVGTVPEAAGELGGYAGDSYYVFDVTKGQFPEVEDGPLATLLAGAGVVDAERLWAAAGRLADGSERTLDDWYPAAGAAALVTDVVHSPAEPGVAAGWLVEQGGRLDPATVALVGAAVLRDEAADPGAVAGVAVAARAAGAGADAVRENAERRSVDQAVAALAAGAPVPPVPPQLGGPARRYAAELCERALRTVPERTVPDLLVWAARAADPLPAAVLAEQGQRALGPALVDPARRAAALAALRTSPPGVPGALAHLERVAGTDPDAVLAALAAGLSEVVDPDQLRGAPAVFRLALVAKVRDAPGNRVDVLRDVVQLAGNEPVGADTLRQLWPDGRCTPAEAYQVVTKVQAADPGSPLAAWVGDAVTRPVPDAGALEDYVQLVGELKRSPWRACLPDQALHALEVEADLGEALNRFYRARRHGAQLAEADRILVELQDAPPNAREHGAVRLGPAFAELRADDLPGRLSTAPTATVRSYLATVEPRLSGRHPDAEIAEAVFGAWHRTGKEKEQARSLLEQSLLATLPKWRSDDLDVVALNLDRQDRKLGHAFDDWRERNCRAGLGKLFRFGRRS